MSRGFITPRQLPGPFHLTLLAAAIGAACVATPYPVLAQAAPAVHELRTEAAPLAEALSRFAAAAGVTLTFDPQQTRDLQAPALNGRYTAERGFAALLAGSGLEAVDRGGGNFVLRPVPQDGATMLPAVKVEGTAESSSGRLPEAYAGGQVARGGRLGMLGNRDFMETPFNQTSYTETLLQDQQARDLSDLLIYEPSVRFASTPTANFGIWHFRGLQVRATDFTFDGLGGMLLPAVQAVERVEVLKGPSALLNGIAPNNSIGGMVNLVPKRAGDRPVTRFTAGFESEALWLGHLDVGRRFGNRREWGVRVNGVHQDGDAALAGNRQERSDGVVALDYRGERLRVKLDAVLSSQVADGTDSDMYLASGAQVPDAPSADRRILQPWNHHQTRERFGVLSGEYDITPEITAYVAAGYASWRRRFNLSYGLNLQESGDFDEIFWGAHDYTRTQSFDAGLNARFATGSLNHHLAIKLSRIDRESGNISFFDGTIDGTLSESMSPHPNNLYEPNFIAAPELRGSPAIPKTGKSVLTSAVLADTLSFDDERLLLTLGVRLQQVENDGFDAQTGMKSRPTYDEQAVTPAAGVVFRLLQSVSLYANYIEGLTQGPTAPSSASNAGEMFPPYKSEQIEAGIKVDFGGWATTFSAFNLSQPATLTVPETLRFTLDGENRYRGLEFTLFGEPVSGVRVLGGATLLDAERIKTNGGTFDGKTATGAPRLSVNLGGEWDASFLTGLSFRVLGIYTDSQYIDQANTVKLDRWTRLDAGTRYAFKVDAYPVTVRASIENISDENYWVSTSLYRGAPRTLMLSATVDF